MGQGPAPPVDPASVKRQFMNFWRNLETLMMQIAFGHHLLYIKSCAAQPFTLKIRARMLKDGTEDEANCLESLYISRGNGWNWHDVLLQRGVLHCF